jgi:outer membrane protein OmpA-like peptidoglycan-associated protein
MKYHSLLAALFLIFFLPSYKTFAQGDTVSFDSFDKSGWYLPNSESDKSEIKGGKLIWEHLKDGNMCTYWTFSSPSLILKNDFSLEADFKVNKSGEYGFIWGGKDVNNAYYFTFSKNQFKTFQYKNSEYSTITDFTKSDKIHSDKNHMKIVKKGDKVIFYANNHKIHEEAAGPMLGQVFGLTLWGPTAVEVDNWLLRQAKSPINLIPGIKSNLVAENLGKNINTIYGENVPFVSPDGKALYFIRYTNPGNIGGEKDGQDIYYSKLGADKKEWGKAVNIGKPLNNPSLNAVCSITPDGNKVLLMNTYNKDGTCNMGVSMSRKTLSGWSFPQSLNINNFYNKSDVNDYFLCNDGKTLLLSVQRDDGYGDLDIHVSFLNKDGSWSEPMNLGSTVNSETRDMSGFLASDGVSLYYSTAGYSGYGDNDIFVTKRLDDTWKHWSIPQNIGKPVNSDKFDAFYTIPASGDYAYFTSNNNSIGEGDLFRIKLHEVERPEPVVLIYGKVFDAETKKPISASILYESLESHKELGIAASDPNTGDYKIVLPYGEHYGFRAEAAKHLTVNENIDINEKKEYIEIHKDLYLARIKIGQTIHLNNIFFVQSKPVLLESSYPELGRLVTILTENPAMEIELSGHTDNVGSVDLNQKLSEERAKTVKDYLVSKGISAKRIKEKGYGGTKPVAGNDTEENRKKNRRVELKITKF